MVSGSPEGGGIAVAARVRSASDAAAFGVATVAASLVAGAVVVGAHTVVLGLCAVVLVAAAVRCSPSLLWGAALVASLFFYHAVWVTPIVSAGGFTLYVSDCLPVLLGCAALAGGIRRPAQAPGVRFSLLAAAAFLVLVLAGAWRTFHSLGMSGVLQARHLLPYALVLVLPFSRTFRTLRAERLATVFALVAIGLAGRSAVLLASGYEARAVPGVQRIYQTWEPFLAAAIGLTLLAFVLATTQARLVHRVGLAASTVPVLFGFFRVAWLLLALVGAVLLVCVRSEGRGARLVVGALFCVALLGGAGLLSPAGSRYEHQLATRAGQINLGLDAYRSREYAAVWTEIRQHPLTGSGFGTEYRADWTIYRSWSHNAYEWFWWRLGLLGLASFAALLVGALAAGLRAARGLAGPDRALAIGLSAGVALTALAANLHENFENYQTNLFIALALAQLLALASRAREQEGTA